MKTLTVHIAGKSFNISLEEEFAYFMQEEFKTLFEGKSSKESDVKRLLSAYVKKCYELYMLNRQIDDITDRFHH